MAAPGCGAVSGFGIRRRIRQMIPQRRQKKALKEIGMLNFLGIGAQKAGTTWLYERLRLHPGLAFPAGKEIHFWNQSRHYGLDWYRGRFADSGGSNGEITPAYAILAPEIIREIHREFPDLRLIYTIRNPISRAWSSAKMEMRRAGMEPDETSDQWFIDHFRSPGSLARGDYLSCIRNWRAVYPAEQLQVLRFEDIQERPLQVLEACCRHLGVPGGVWEDGPGIREKVFSSGNEPLRSSLRPALLDLYWDRILSLSDYLGQDLSAWLAEGRMP